ncbi:MAG: response regulator [Ilumatobacteraceae bacterium]
MNRTADGGGRSDVNSGIEVVIADDHPLVLQGLRAVVSGTADIRIVGEATDGAAAIEVVLDRQPDVAIVDLDMPEVHGVEVTRRITEALPSTTVIVLTMLDDDDTVLAALRAGASGYLLKGTNGANILSAIRSAAAGTAVLDPACSAASPAERAKHRQTLPNRSPSSQPANETSSPISQTASPTPRSATASTSRRRRSPTTCRRSSPSCKSPNAAKRSSSPRSRPRYQAAADVVSSALSPRPHHRVAVPAIRIFKP